MLAVYTGRPMEYNGIIRMCPQIVESEQQWNELQHGDQPFTQIGTERSAYIGRNADGLNFENDILPHIPLKPNVLLMRDEGAGDVLMSVPTVRELKRRLPDARITYATRPALMELLAGVEAIDNVVSVHGIDLSAAAGWDLIVNWCRALEMYSIPRNRRHRIDSFAAHVGLRLENRELELHLGLRNRRKAADFVLPRTNVPTIGIVLKAATWSRTWTPWRCTELVAELETAMPGVSVVVIDDQKTGRGICRGDRVVDLAGDTDSFCEAAAVCELCDLVISPDTGLAHACAALGVPCLVLCGTIPPEKRYSTYKNFDWIYAEGRVDCCPCWNYQERWTAEERKQKTRNGTYKSCRDDCIPWCMDAITPKEIADKAAEMMGRQIQ